MAIGDGVHLQRMHCSATRCAGDGGAWSAHRSAGEHFSMAGRREDAGYRLPYFSTWAKAGAMQHWIDRSGIAYRPIPAPFNGPALGAGSGAH